MIGKLVNLVKSYGVYSVIALAVGGGSYYCLTSTESGKALLESVLSYLPMLEQSGNDEKSE